MQNLRWKIITIVAVLVIFSALGIYPILAARLGVHSPGWLMDKQLKLGLDLKGGVHLVLRVQTDDALRLESDTEMERLREELQSKNITFSKIDTTSPTQFRVDGVPPTMDANFRQAATGVQANFDRGSSGDGSDTFTRKPNVHVQLPGVPDVERAKEIMGSQGLLELKIVEQARVSDRNALLVNGQVPSGDEILPGAGSPGDASTVYYLVKKVAAVTGRDLRNARPSLDENNQPAVSFTLNNEGGRKFGKVTGDNIGRQLAIILDGRVQSAPRIDSRITTEGRITGSFTQDEVQNLSLILRSGALPAKLDYLEERTIGPSLGADSIRSGII